MYFTCCYVGFPSSQKTLDQNEWNVNIVDKNCYSLIFQASEQFHYIDGLSTLNLKEYTTINIFRYEVMNMNYFNSNKNMLHYLLSCQSVILLIQTISFRQTAFPRKQQVRNKNTKDA